MTAMLWTLMALMVTGLVALMVDARAGRRELRSELKGDIAGLRSEMGGLRTELKGDIAELRTELKGDIAELRTDLQGQVTGLRAEQKSDMRTLQGEVHLLAERQAEMNGRLDVVVAMAHTHPPAVAGRQG